MLWRKSFFQRILKLDRHTSKAQNMNGNRSTKELIKNGRFEVLSNHNPDIFASWRFDNIDRMLMIPKNIAFEGNLCALVRTKFSDDFETKTCRIFQTVSVAPGSQLQLEFTDNFHFASLEAFVDLNIVARVYYGDSAFNSPGQVDLIRMEIDYDLENADRGFIHHQQSAAILVPTDVSCVTVEFQVTAIDRPLSCVQSTQWLLDNVSLKSVF